MFSSAKYSQCLGVGIIQSKEAQSSKDSLGDSNYPGYIEIPAEASGASAVLVQVYYNPDEVADLGIDLDTLAGKPLVTIDEFTDFSSVPVNEINKEWATPGMKLLNYGNFLIETGINIKNAKIIPFNTDINVYVCFNYYK